VRYRGTVVCALVVGLLAHAPAVVRAHGGGEEEEAGDAHEPDPHAGDMLIGSTQPGGGALAIAFDFSTVVRVSLADVVGSISLYTAVDPGFAVAGAAADGMHPLRRGSEVRLEVTGVDDGQVAIVLNGALAARVGDAVVLGTTGAGPAARPHRHPEIQLRLAMPPGEFGEGAFSFRLTTPSPAYAPSETYTLRVSNGHLAAPVRAKGLDVRRLSCQRALARHAWRLLRAPMPDRAGAEAALLRRCGPAGSRTYEAPQIRAFIGLVTAHGERLAGLTDEAAMPECRRAMARGAAAVQRARGAGLTTCLIRIETLEAMEEAGMSVPSSAAEAVCAAPETQGPPQMTLLGRIAHARARARASIRRRCGAGGAARDVLAASSCAADDLVSAIFDGAKSRIAPYRARPSQGGRPLDTYFGCLAGGAAGHQHTHE
jgi:hypothetical protein